MNFASSGLFPSENPHIFRLMSREKIAKTGGIYENRSYKEAKDDRHLF